MREKLQNRIGNTSKEFEDQNTRLKKILGSIRSPQKLFIDVILILILLFMLYILMKLITKKYKSSVWRWHLA